MSYRVSVFVCMLFYVRVDKTSVMCDGRHMCKLTGFHAIDI